MMRVISINVWGGLLHELLMDYVAGCDADVLCLQEVGRTPSATQDWLTYRDRETELKQRTNLFSELRAALPGYDAFFCPTASGDLFDGDRPYPSDFGLATFVRQTHSVIGQALAFVHGEYGADGWGSHPRARNAHCIRVYNRDDDFTVTIAQMHGLRELSGKQDTPARLAQAKAFASLIENVWNGRERLIACGDFNVLPDSATFHELGRLGLTDLVTSRGFTDTRTSHYPKSGRYADYLLANDAVEILDFDVVAAPEVSDHRALLLDFA